MSENLNKLTIKEAHDDLVDVLPASEDEPLSIKAANTIIVLHRRWVQTEGADIANRRLPAAVGEAATTLTRLQEEAGDTYA